MEVFLWQNLLHNISSFFCLSKRDNFCSESVKNCYIKVEEMLNLLKPVAELILDVSIASSDQLSKALEHLVRSIEECTNLFENWHPLASRLYLVMEVKFLVKSMQTSIEEIVQLLKDLPPFLNEDSIPKCFEHCIENVKNIGCESTSTSFLEAMKGQASSHGTPWLADTAECLGSSSEDILIEAVALEKLKEDAELAGNDDVANNLKKIITLLTLKHDRLIIWEQSKIGFSNSFICPLSLEIMRDPVILSSGQTYERAYIKKWLDLGLTVCPKTRQKLVYSYLIPNYTCKALIANYHEKNKVEPPAPDPINSMNGHSTLSSRRDIVEDSDATVKKLVEDLRIEKEERLREATDRLRQFVKQNMDNRIQFTYFGGIRLAVDLLYSTDPKVQENAVAALLYMSINDDIKVVIADEDAIEPLIRVLKVGTSEARENSAATLFCLSMIDKNKLRIGNLGAIVPLVELLCKGTPLGKNNAVIALFNLSLSHKNRARIVQAGAVRLLVELVYDPVEGLVDKAIAVLASLVKIPEGRTAIGQAGGIPALINVLELGSVRAKRIAVSALLHLCTYSSKWCKIALQEAIIPPLVALSLSGRPIAEAKAHHLLSYLRSIQGRMSEYSSSSLDFDEDDPPP